MGMLWGMYCEFALRFGTLRDAGRLKTTLSFVDTSVISKMGLKWVDVTVRFLLVLGQRNLGNFKN